jgi:voltage-gated potassium channel Kch
MPTDQPLGLSALPRDGQSPSEDGQPLFLVCGLGGLGQYCASILKTFGCIVYGVSASPPEDWEVPDLPNQLDRLWIGDYRQRKVLENADILKAQAVLFVANDEPANIEAAFTARLINPYVRIVIRSAKQNLNQLLSQNLGNFVAFEPNQLAVSAFGLAALGSETQAILQIEQEVLSVIQTHISMSDPRLGRSLQDFQTSQRRLLSYQTSSHPSLPEGLPESKSLFFAWHSEQPITSGDQVVYIQLGSQYHQFSLTEPLRDGNRDFDHSSPKTQSGFWRISRPRLSWKSWQLNLSQVWGRMYADPPRRIALITSGVILVLCAIGTILYQLYYPQISLMEAFHATISLLLGGYGDVFGGVTLDIKVPVWLQFFSLGLALVGTAFVGIIYALLTESLLSSRLKFLQRRRPIPKQGHLILIGFGEFGQKVGAFFQELRQPIVGISESDLDIKLFEQFPVVIGEPIESLATVNLSTARSVVVTTEDEMTNLEVGLAAHASNTDVGLVIRMFDQRFSQTLQQLLPYAKVFCAHALAAEAFASAAFGENILGLFRLQNQTVLVTEYQIDHQDTLHEKLLFQVEYGFDVLPILHQKKHQEFKFFPSDDIRLEVGDRLIVLATLASLQRIESGNILPPTIDVELSVIASPHAIFEAVNILTRLCGCPRSDAQEIMNQIPTRLPFKLYPHQAARLVRQLRKNFVMATIQS